ncbi:MAG: hypothetical protein KME26_18250 [Oscillatoria princeps RMCB-10]|nr:hypothetical protein [Oscillatoria princeps RMCB-10]
MIANPRPPATIPPQKGVGAKHERRLSLPPSQDIKNAHASPSVLATQPAVTGIPITHQHPAHPRADVRARRRAERRRVKIKKEDRLIKTPPK